MFELELYEEVSITFCVVSGHHLELQNGHYQITYFTIFWLLFNIETWFWCQHICFKGWGSQIYNDQEHESNSCGISVVTVTENRDSMVVNYPYCTEPALLNVLNLWTLKWHLNCQWISWYVTSWSGLQLEEHAIYSWGGLQCRPSHE